MKKITFLLAVLVLTFFSRGIYARTNVMDWYIKDFQSEIVVNKDSTLLITERITADCGNASGKHGIFRILPTALRTTDKTISMPIELVSITDFNGKSLQYSMQNNNYQNSVTWKIGDPDVTVTGENKYLITYKVKNALLFGNPDFDEFYWNLNGNFWDIETDSFTGKIVFPAEVTKNNTQIDYYVGSLGSKNKDGADYDWTGDNALQFKTDRTLLVGEGITASVTFPKNIFMPYQPTFLEKYAFYLWFLIPLIAFFISFNLWKKYGKDPRMDKTIIAEVDVPEQLSPLELGVLSTNGSLKNEFITASIINLAVTKIIRIGEVKKSGFFSLGNDYGLTMIDRRRVPELSRPEQILVERIFGNKDEVMLSSLKNKFYQHISEIKNEAVESLEKKRFIEKSGLTYHTIFIVTGLFLIFAAVALASYSLLSLPAMFLTVVIIFIFAFLMPKRTPEGAEVNWKIQGFKLYMETAEKYRAEFYEKENIFEKFLPYAIMFGMTKLWIKKMKEIYGENYFNTYHPAWFVGGSLASFDADSFASHIDSLSSAMESNVSSGSGSGGGGSSGGGGGGGGGGGW